MTQRAAVYAKKHEYPVIQERPIPTPGENQVLLKVTAVGLNPIEWKIIEYGLYRDPPTILGYDVGGVIEDVGPNVSNYKKGDRIISWTLRTTDDESGLQQFALVGTAPYLTAKIPESISEDEAVTLPTALNTASVALYDSDGFGFPSPFKGGEGFGKDKAILVTGGSSVIGLAALQLLRLSGFSKIIAVAAKKHEPLVTKYGATHVIDRFLPMDTQVEQIRSIAPTLHYAWDPIASIDTSELAARSFGDQGGLIVGSLPINASVLAAHKNVAGKHIVSNPADHQASATILWTHLEEALRKGDIVPLPYQVGGGLAKTAEALQSVKKASGYKVIVHPQE